MERVPKQGGPRELLQDGQPQPYGVAATSEQVFFTTDHPNGGPFTSYPHLIRLLPPSLAGSTDSSLRATAWTSSRVTAPRRSTRRWM